MDKNLDFIAQFDPTMAAAMKDELSRQRRTLS